MATARQPRPDQPQEARAGAAVLAERIAATLVSHEPGWRLPRHSALARRYHVSTAEIDAAIGELCARQLVRRLPDGQVYRASPAHYTFTMEGLPGLAARIDPMGASITCTARKVSLRRIPEDIGLILGLPPGSLGTVIRCLWTANGQHGALSTTYLPGQVDVPPIPDPELSSPDLLLNSPPGLAAPAIPGPPGLPAALLLEVQPPQASVARGLGLTPGAPAVGITVKFSRPPSAHALALTAAVMRPDVFKIVIEAAPRAAEPASLPLVSQMDSYDW